ncbi:benzoyl-CoA 2,3-epoxidase subunit BoxB [Phaeacidiphilus oryzae]|uniref:benzoyl-CoA 2,3-epoxidase subunit BoxB n=1 Tax=Phaeacidiphilus oryzae TaxID=348818 RepID=UPI000562BC85|nr:benzoyl-CoA 2,3-epoxidase subunit BoxB [Phaeacidiphilus oryzae]
MSTQPATSPIDYDSRIPNNVGLAEDRRLQRALESWQPQFLDWWLTMGPALGGALDSTAYLRTAVAVGRAGWAHFDHVRLPDYRWGIFLAEREPDRRIGFGEHRGEPVWQQIPGEYRAELQRLVVIQGDTEPASVEQQRLLGLTAPSLYDLRNLFQVNVEEGRHLWAMVYLLHAYFGREGREEAQALLHRNSGSPDAPRILGAFNEETADWLAFFMFTYFTDRDGKYQLGTLKESAFDPLSRTAEFMLKEEAHHMFVGVTGVDRVVRRSAELTREHDTLDIADAGGIPLPVVQKYLNFHYSVSLDLFGGETSTNAANYYTAGLKGRWQESRRRDGHRLSEDAVQVDVPAEDGSWQQREVPALTALNLDLRDSYIADCRTGVKRWNRILAAEGVDHRLYLPHPGFNRRVGAAAGHHITPDGEITDAETWAAARDRWLPTPADLAFVRSLMRPVYQPGRIAPWLAPPAGGINGKPLDYEYVRL